MEYSIYKHKSAQSPMEISYWNQSLIEPCNFYNTGFSETLEKIVSKENNKTPDNFPDRIILDKSKTTKATIKALLNEVLLRKKLNSELTSRIDSDLCDTHSNLEQILTVTARDYEGSLTSNLNRRKTQLESQSIDLEKEKRQEYVTCWRDMMFLKKYLLSALKDYWNANSSKSFLNIENDKHRGYMQETEAYNWK